MLVTLLVPVTIIRLLHPKHFLCIRKTNTVTIHNHHQHRHWPVLPMERRALMNRWIPVDGLSFQSILCFSTFRGSFSLIPVQILLEYPFSELLESSYSNAVFATDPVGCVRVCPLTYLCLEGSVLLIQYLETSFLDTIRNFLCGHLLSIVHCKQWFRKIWSLLLWISG